MDASLREAWSSARPTPDHGFDTACVAPWVSLEFDPSGWVYACCTSGMYPLGRIGEDRLGDLWGGPRAQVLRESLQRWDLTVACGPCRWHLEHGRLDPVAAVYDQYPVQSQAPDRPYMMLFALSNRCNLGCIMCTPELSTKLRIEAGLPALVPRYDDQFFADLEPLLGDLKLAKFLGGEPFLAPEHRRVWALMDRLDTPPRMQITTNGTIWNDYVEWLMGRFVVDISISIDAATAPTYEMVRRGGNFDELMTNIDRFDAACRAGGTELHVSYCLMNCNWTELADFLVWAERFDVPASVNLVTDDGLGLHDESLDDLLAVRAAWSSADEAVRSRLSKNVGVWATQLTQLDAVIEERREGVVPAPRQAQRAARDLFAPQRDRPVVAAARRPFRRRVAEVSPVEGHVRRLAAWSTDDSVAMISIGLDGVISAVPRPHATLGVDERLVGDRADELVARLEVAVGRTAWLVEMGDLDDGLVRTVAFAQAQPVRGTTGVLVRTIEVADAGGWTLLLAQDEIYDDGSAVPVALVGRGGRHDS